MKKIHILLVGMGRASRQMSPYLTSKPWFSLAGVVDVDPHAVENAKRYFNREEIPFFPDLETALAEVSADAAIINTHAWLHFEHAEKCLNAGLDVIAAKPFTHSFDSASALVELAAGRSLKLCVGQQGRYDRQFRSLRGFLNDGKLGRVNTASYVNRVPRPAVGNLGETAEPVLFELSSHHFDTILSTFDGCDPEWVMCNSYKTAWSPYKGHCMVDAIIAFEGGINLLYHTGFTHHDPKYEFHLQGEKGFLSCRGRHFNAADIRYTFGSQDNDAAPIDIESGYPIGNAWDIMLEKWHRYLTKDEGTPFVGSSNLKIMAMIDAAVESSAKGARVEIKNNKRYAKVFKKGPSH